MKGRSENQSKETEISCIRVFADVVQIRNCRERIKEVDGVVDKLSNALNLAGNKVRLSIMFLLFEEESLCVCDLSDILQMKIPAISQHLRKLRDGGLIRSKKAGQTVFYSLIPEYQNLFNSYFNLIAENKITEEVA